jgi:predicted Na+-dependent transporter
MQDDVTGMFARSGLAVTLLMAVTASSAWFVATRLRLTVAQGRTLVLEVGVQNINMALVIALTILEEPSYLGPALVYMPLMLAFGGLVILASKYQGERSPTLGAIRE